MYGESKEALKAKIKEMIIAELSLTEEDGAAVTDSYYNFNENVGEVGEKDYEEYQELKKFLNSLEDTNFESSISSELSKRNSDGPDEDYYETEGNGEIDDYDTEYDLGEGKFKLKEFL